MTAYRNAESATLMTAHTHTQVRLLITARQQNKAANLLVGKMSNTKDHLDYQLICVIFVWLWSCDKIKSERVFMSDPHNTSD